MRKQMKAGKSIFIKSVSFTAALCMMLGSISVPVMAEEKDNVQEIQDIPKSENTEADMVPEIPDTEESENVPAPGQNLEEKEPEDETNLNDNTGEETIPDDETVGETVPDDEIEKEMVSGNAAVEKTVSGNDIGKEIEKEEEKNKSEDGKEKTFEKTEVPEMIDVVVPVTYTLALNPYRLPVRTGEDEISTEQILSGTYGIVNRSSTDQIVTVSLMVEDCNGGELLFVDSVEEAENAGENVYAIYLAAVPANEELVLLDGAPVDSNVAREELQNVWMNGAEEQAVALYGGVNQIAFKLSGAVYDADNDDEHHPDDIGNDSETISEDTEEGNEMVSEDIEEGDETVSEDTEEGNETIPDDLEDSDETESDVLAESSETVSDTSIDNDESTADISEDGDGALPDDREHNDETGESVQNDVENDSTPQFVLKQLASDGTGVTAYTFMGVMNPHAEWEKLQGGIKLSVVYTYRTADGNEEIMEGTGAMLRVE